MSPLKRKRLTETLRHAYSEWQWRSAAVWAAYERWAAGGDGVEFAAYHVALDLEETACLRYMEIAQQV
jgi:hypothetical protein